MEGIRVFDRRVIDFNQRMKAFVDQGDANGARRVFEDMKRKGIEPDCRHLQHPNLLVRH